MKTRKNNGSTMIMVVVGVSVIAILGLMILLAASTYYRTIIVNGNSQKNFYGTEAIVEEVRNGLGECGAKASEQSYRYILQNYSGYTPMASGDTRKDVFAKKYLSSLVGTLTNNPSYVWAGNSPKADNVDVGAADINVIKKMTNTPDAVLDTGNVRICLSDLTSFKLTLKNVTVKYTTPSDYSTTLVTDIVLSIPDMHLDGDTTFNELKNYIVISDNSIDLSSTVGTGTQLTGNVYTGSGGINVQSGTIATLNSNMIISRGDINIKSGSNVTINGNDGSGLATMWIENLILSRAIETEPSSETTHLNCKANSYVANDMSLNDDHSDVNISGAYYGYNFNETNSTATTVQKANYSSAILINGFDNYLNMDGVNQLILAGRAFVSRKDESNSSVNSDIQTGESLSVKSNQVAYLMPNDYISVGHNPVLKDEWESEPSMINKTNLLASEIGKYLDTTKPYIENFFSSGYVYYFLNFKDEQSANAYFKQFYQDNKDALLEQARTYITSTNGTNVKLSPALYLLAGHIVDNYDANDAKMDEANYFNGTSPSSTLLSDAIIKAKEYMGRQLTLLPGYSKSELHFSSAEGKNADPLVDSLIDFSDCDAADSHDGITIVDGNYEVTSATKGILLCTGDVTCSADFEGLIIAKGKVSVSNSNIKLTYNSQLVKELLAKAASDDVLKKYFKGISSNDSAKSTKVNVMDYITYENWSKNEE